MTLEETNNCEIIDELIRQEGASQCIVIRAKRNLTF